MRELRHSRGHRTGHDAHVGQNDSRDQIRREESLTKLPRVTVVQTASCSEGAETLVLCDPTNGGFTVNIPSANAFGRKTITVKNASVSANTVTIQPRSGTIDDAATAAIAASRGVVRLIADARRNDWIVV